MTDPKSNQPAFDNRRNEVLVAMQVALLGEVAAQLRIVAVRWDEASVNFVAYFDGEISEEDQESMSCVETELIAWFPQTPRISYEVHRLDYPEHVPRVPGMVFAYSRREPELE